MRALLVEDQPIFRAAIADILKARLVQVELCFAETLPDALHCVENHGPRLVLADLSTIVANDAAGLERLVSYAGETPVVALDDRLQPSRVRRARSAGAKAYIAKTSSPQLIDAAIGVVIAGGEFFPRVTHETRALQADDAPEWVRSLSDRQLEVLQLIMQGKTNGEVAAALGISVPTTKLHVHAILRAAGVRNRTEAAFKAKGSW
jgi:DNA-binding NarL/FixJ family response regulator